MKSTVLLAALLLMTQRDAAQAQDSLRIYSRIVQSNPNDSRAVFRLARLQRSGSPEAIALFERYTRLEPGDAWGHLALAEALAAAGRFDDAMLSVARAEQRAPGERDVAITKQRIERSRRSFAPTLQPRVAITRDSDANQLRQLVLTSDGPVPVTPGARIGAAVTYSETSDGATSFSTLDARLSTQLRTGALRVELNGGGARVQSTTEQLVPVVRTRLRWNPSPNAPSIELRAAHAPMLVSPLLMSNLARLTEARSNVDLPVFGMLRVRANGQLGWITTKPVAPGSPPPPGCENPNPQGQGRDCPEPIRGFRRNVRRGLGGGMVLRVNPVTEFSVTYYQLSYDLPAQDGYFAPRRVQILELGNYAEVYRFDPLTIAFDLGAGIQRSATHGAEFGGWSSALRGWSQLTLSLGRATELSVETEAYQSQMNAIATSGSWSSVSTAVFVRWLIL
jgi:hypothetical protein